MLKYQNSCKKGDILLYNIQKYKYGKNNTTNVYTHMLIMIFKIYCHKNNELFIVIIFF